MNATATQCPVCGKTTPPQATRLGPLCPGCLLQSGRTPAGEEETSTWADVFPHLEIQYTLRVWPDRPVYRVRLMDEQGGTATHAVLQIATGPALAAAGGVPAVLGCLQRLMAEPVAGLAAILDCGDLADACYLLTAEPSFPALSEVLAQQPRTAVASVLARVGQRLDPILRGAETAGCRFLLDPDLVFFAEAGDELVVTPPLAGLRCAADTPDALPFAPLKETWLPGDRLAGYELEARIGEGGFGEVWRAWSLRPPRTRVAVKLLKHGLHSARARARFDLEQQALARLDHPGIARFLGGGTTPDGRPFFAMEWVDGDTIIRFCREHQLPLDTRLALVRDACLAVHHAHQKGVMHRDLKPSNVMVATGDAGRPTPKIIDFGIAKSLDDPDREATFFTRADELLGTPATMSPEQAAGADAAALDARTDVYGLGVILYELLAGTPPFDPALPPDELRRHIRESDPPPPSARTTDPAAARAVRGELDWITLKCLEKSPDRRYASVLRLAEDLDRFAQNQPLEAGPPQWSYRARKFLRRYRRATLSAAAVLISLITGLLLTAAGFRAAKKQEKIARDAEGRAQAQRLEAEQARASAESLAQFLGKTLASTNSDVAGPSTTVADMLTTATARLRANKSLAPLDHARFLLALGETFHSRGMRDQAIGVLEEAVALRTTHLGDHHKDTLKAMLPLAQAHRGRDGMALAERAVQAWRQHHAGDQAGLVNAENLFAELCANAGELEKAGRVFQDLVSRTAQVYGPDHVEVFNAQVKEAEFHASMGRWDTSLALNRSAHAGLLRHKGPLDAGRLEAAVRLGWRLYQTNSTEAVSHFENLLHDVKRVFPEHHQTTLDAENGLAAALVAAGETARAEALRRGLLARIRAASPDDAERIGEALSNLRWVLSEAGRHGEALEVAREAVQLSNASLGESHPRTIRSFAYAAGSAFRAGEADEGIALSRTLADRLIAARAPESDVASPVATIPGVPDALSGFMGIEPLEVAFGVEVSSLRDDLMALGQYELAEVFAMESVNWCRGRHGEKHPFSANALGRLAQVWAHQDGKFEQARALYEDLLIYWRRQEATLPPSYRTMENLLYLGRLLKNGNKFEEAIPILEEGLLHAEFGFTTAHGISRQALASLASAHFQSDSVKSIPLFERFVELESSAPQLAPSILFDAQKLLGDAYVRHAGELARGVAMMEQALAGYRSLPKADLPDALGVLAHGYLRQRRFAEAAALYEESLAILECTWSREALARNHQWNVLLEAYDGMGQSDKAVSTARTLTEMRREVLGEDDSFTRNAVSQLASLLGRAGNHRESVTLLEDLLPRLSGPDQALERNGVLGQLVRDLERTGRVAEAAVWREERERSAAQLLEAGYAPANDAGTAGSVVLVAADSVWRWWHPPVEDANGDAVAEVYAHFAEPGFDDTGWTAGRISRLAGVGSVGAASAPAGAFLAHRFARPDGPSRHRPTLFRHHFTTDRRHDALELLVQADDGVVVFLDGVEVARENVLLGRVGPALYARACRNGWPKVKRIPLPGSLEPGPHVLALSLHDHDCWRTTTRLAGVELRAVNTPAAPVRSPVFEPGSPEAGRFRELVWLLAQRSLREGNRAEARARLLLVGMAELAGDSAPFLEKDSDLPRWLTDLMTVGWLDADGREGATSVKSWVQRGSDWRFHHGGDRPPDGWSTPAFDDNAWIAAPAPLGYGDPAVRSAVAPGDSPETRPRTVYFRKSFEVGDDPPGDAVYVALRADDGAAVILNGEEVVRLRLPDGPLSPKILANTVVNDGMEAEYSVHRIPASLLRRGRNVLAVEVHQAEANSSDVLFDLELVRFDMSLISQALQRLYQTFRPDETLAAIRRDWTFSLPDPPADWRDRVQARLLAAAAAATRK